MLVFDRWRRAALFLFGVAVAGLGIALSTRRRWHSRRRSAKTLSDPTAEVCVCSSHWTGKIDAEFYSKPLPACGGKSIPNIFEKLRPYFRRWK